ncbi:MAG: isoleucine--tRNA ligase [Verrucomicrobiota bacterium]
MLGSAFFPEIDIMSDPSGKRYKDTLHLPQTTFPMRGDLVKKEPLRLKKWEASRLSQRIAQKRQAAQAPKYILHDGPPFANGDVHMGTALNKVLKDFVVKSRTMAGHYVPFVPGWDCHGLPIEFRVVKESRGLRPVEIRQKSEAYARKFIEIQRQSFKRLGVFGDWEHPYLTLDPAYEADVMRVFAKMVEKDIVYRSKKPVLWSYGAQTALAEAEVEYQDKVSPAVFAEFPIVGGPLEGQGSFVIWTTTPWTLPSNLGIALHGEFEYVLGQFQQEGSGRKTLLVARALLESFAEKTGWQLVEELSHHRGRALEGSLAQHPFLDRTAPVFTALFVTAETGTGAVHIAPGHGADDYQAGREQGLEVLSPVADDGTYTEEVGIPELVGRLVFDANPAVVALLQSRGRLLGEERHQHQYPYCWRSKTPILFRAVEQFFVQIDALRGQALEEVERVRWLPAWGRNRIAGTVESRPDWCISRQRTWGVPLPVFYDAQGQPLLNAELARQVAALIEKEGSHLWFTLSDEEWAERLGLPAGTTKCRDTLDVWIDSGSSHVAVLDRHPELEAPADLYLEATDQHRGWFQSSLMLSTAVRGAAPYKTVITHGFVTDTSGQKISKSGDKPVNAEHYYNKYGADIVRLWVSSVDYQTEVPFSDDLFKQVINNYRSLRNTFRVLLGNLADFDPATDTVPAEDLTLIDRWILEKLHDLTQDCLAAYQAYDFRKVFILVTQFFSVDLSALYIDITKDRLYCDPAKSLRRRSSQTAIQTLVSDLTRLLAPILAFTADEVWEHFGQAESVHEQDFPTPDPAFAQKSATPVIEELLQVRDPLQQELEKARQAKTIGSNLEAEVALSLPPSSQLTSLDQEVVAEFLILSQVQLSGSDSLSVRIARSQEKRCERCWKQLPDVGTIASHPTLCQRCAEAVLEEVPVA